jgi:hypothetical protein
MKRHEFTLALSWLFIGVPLLARAQTLGIRVRFVIARSSGNAAGATTTATYENAVLMKEGEKFEAVFSDRYRLSLQPIPEGETVRIIAALCDTVSHPEETFRGEASIRRGFGTGLELGSIGSETYRLGLFVTPAPLPPSAA